MKDQDLMRALGNLPQDMLDEFAEWNENGTPLSGSDAESTAEITRANDVISAKKRDISVTKSRPWKIGICAAMAACLVMAVSVGREAISRSKDSMSVGYSAGDSVETEVLTELSHDNYDEIKMNGMNTATKRNRADAPYSLSAQIIRTPEQAQSVIDFLTPEDPADNSAELLLAMLDADALAEQDVIFFGIPQEQFAGDASGAAVAYRCVEITRDGKLTLDAVCMQHISPEPSDRAKEYINYYGIAVEKNVLPDLTDFSLRLTKFRAENMPQDVKLEKDGWRLEKYREYQAKYGDEWKAFNAFSQNQEGFRLWLEKEQTAPENPEVQVVEQVIGEPFYAWYWHHYSGDDIAVPAGGRLEVLHNAEEAAAFLTNSGQQPKELAEYMNAAWFAGEGEPLMEGDTSCEPHDVIFVGIPAREMPENVISWSYRDGTVTPSGRLHLVCNVMTGSGEQAEPVADGENFYFFMSVPKGRLPEITEWSVTFDEFHSDAAVYSTEQDGQAHYKDWLMEQPVTQSYWAASLCQKYIRPVPDVQPDTVTVQGSRIMHISDTETEASASVLTYKSDAAAEITDVDWEKYDVVQITLPSDDARAAVSITDLAIDADGILSLNYNIGKQEQEYAETGAFSFRLLVPKGTVPPITGINAETVVYEKSYEPDEDTDEYTFIHKSSGLMTIDISAAK